MQTHRAVLQATVQHYIGTSAASASAAQVHFDCKFKGIDAVSSRYARTLGGNRTIAEVCHCRAVAAMTAAIAGRACAVHPFI
jgi:hypothetical protein